MKEFFQIIIKMDKKDIPAFEKEKGKKLFAEKNYEDAIKSFTKVIFNIYKAIYGTQMLTKDEAISPEEYINDYNKGIVLPCHLNLSICLMKINNYQLALKHTSAVFDSN